MTTNEETANLLINLADQLRNQALELIKKEKESKPPMIATATVVSVEASVSKLKREYISLKITIPLFLAVVSDSPRHYELEKVLGRKVERESPESLESLKGQELRVLLSFEEYLGNRYFRVKRLLALEEG